MSPYNRCAMAELTWPTVLSRLLSGHDLAQQEASWAMERIMSGEAAPAQIGAFVAALRAKGETVEEIAGLVATMRRLALKVPVDGPVVDTRRPRDHGDNRGHPLDDDDASHEAHGRR